MDSRHPYRRRSDALQGSGPALPDERAGRPEVALSVRVTRACLGTALALTVSVALVLVFVIGSLASLGGGDA